FKILKRPNIRKSELKLGNDLKEVVESVGDVNLVLGSRFELILKNTFYVSSFRRNLIFVSCLDKLGLSFTFGERKINLMLNSQIIGYGSLMDDLYKLSLASDNIHLSKIKEKSFMLWHKHLCHTSKERIEILTKINILPSLNFDDLVTCVDCIGRKFTKTKRNVQLEDWIS
ncbi:hypothetical protein CR513_37345, partial [Mucuna pruriens]